MTEREKQIRSVLDQALMRLDRAMPFIRGLVNSEGLAELASSRLNLVAAIDTLGAGDAPLA